MRCSWLGIVALVIATAAFAEAPQVVCKIEARHADERLSFEWKSGECASKEHCHSRYGNSDMSWSKWQGISPADLDREGAALDAHMKAEAGEIRCAGTVHSGVLNGTYSFTPDTQFAQRMEALGFDRLTTERLEGYALLDVTTAWTREMKDAGVQGMTSEKLMGLRALGVNAAYVKGMSAAGYPELQADKLTGMKAVGVSPEKVAEVHAMGFTPSQEELIQMSVFKIDAPFIERMKSKGFAHPTISQLVKIKIFKLDE
jgi:hypothetical protein